MGNVNTAVETTVGEGDQRLSLGILKEKIEMFGEGPFIMHSYTGTKKDGEVEWNKIRFYDASKLQIVTSEGGARLFWHEKNLPPGVDNHRNQVIRAKEVVASETERDGNQILSIAWKSSETGNYRARMFVKRK